MTLETILYLSDQATSSDSLLAALKATGYEVVSTNSAAQAIALLYIMHSAAAVVLHHGAGQGAGLDVARSLRAIHPDVPIVLLCRDRVDRLPSCVDACVTTGQPVEKLASAVRRLLTEQLSPVHSAQC
jgi:DNA-binding response OmpR family regulator